MEHELSLIETALKVTMVKVNEDLLRYHLGKLDEMIERCRDIQNNLAEMEKGDASWMRVD